MRHDRHKARWFTGLVFALCLGIACTIPAFATAASGGASSMPHSATCPNSHLLEGGLFTDLCWQCFFPIEIEGIPIGPPNNRPDDVAAPVCVCPGRVFGMPSLGTTIGFWEPSHLFEVVRQPWCSPILGQPLLSSKVGGKSGAGGNVSGSGKPSGGWLGLSRWGGYSANTKANQSVGVTRTFYNWHWWIYPAAVVINGLIGDLCSKKTGSGMDIAYISEIDPTWVNDEMALYTTPEARLFANPIAIAACAADAVASTVSKPIRYMYWCAGTWGTTYPFTGNITNHQDPERNASLTVFRALAALQRRTLAKRSYGNQAVCTNTIAPMILKQQYKLQSMYPMPDKSHDHWLGASPFKWGEWRNIPWRGEDFVIVEWQFEECCVTYW